MILDYAPEILVLLPLLGYLIERHLKARRKAR